MRIVITYYSADEAETVALVDKAISSVLVKAKCHKEKSFGGYLDKLVFITDQQTEAGRAAILKNKAADSEKRKCQRETLS